MKKYNGLLKLWKKSVLMLVLVFLYTVGSNIRAERVSAASQAETVVNYALSQVGVKERAAGTDNVIYNDWYYGHQVSNPNPSRATYPWCHVFISYCANRCGVSASVIPKTASCAAGVSFFQRQGRYHTRASGYVPVVGDIIYLSTDGTSTAHHVGIVYAVDSSYVYYVDGNNTSTSPHGVARSKMSRSNSRILGYGNPAYATSSAPIQTLAPVPAQKQYSIDNVQIKSIDADRVTITWNTTNLPRCIMVVNAGGQTWKSSYAVGAASLVTNSFSATFDRSTVSNCPDNVNILLYGYSTVSGAGLNETLHRVTYGSSVTGVLVFPARQDKYWSEKVPATLISHENFAGWVISDTANISNVYVAINGTKLYCTLGSRADVSKAYPNYKYVRGYSLQVTPYYVQDGTNSYRIVATLANGKSYTIKSGTFQAEKCSLVYDDDFFRMRYESNPTIKKLSTAASREKFFYQNLNNKIDGKYLCGSIVCDLQYYNDANGDLKKRQWSGYEIYDHLIHYGLKASGGKEYRAVSPWVSLYYLHTTYSDLKGMTPEQLFTWAATYGAKIDQRLLSNTNAAKAYRNFYQCTQYASLNRDLVKAYGSPKLTADFTKSSCSKYWTHLWNYGVKERRKTSNSFNANVYCKNAGLSSSATTWNVFDHYCTTGYARKIKTK